MKRLESIPLHDPELTIPAIFNHAVAVRKMLERAWNDKTAYQGITLEENDPISRGQCGVSSLWLARYMTRAGVDARFTEGKIFITGQPDDHVWVEVDALGKQYVLDITSDQYKISLGSSVHLGEYDDTHTVGHYEPSEHFSPDDVPRKKLLGRYSLLVDAIDRLPKQLAVQMR